MPTWVEIVTGVIAAAAAIGLAVYLAVRPYLTAAAPKPLMPDSTGEATVDSIAGVSSSWPDGTA